MASRGGYNFGGSGPRRGGRGGRGGGPPGGGGRGGKFSGGRGAPGEASDVVCRSFLSSGKCTFGGTCRYAHNVMLLKQGPAGPDVAAVKLRGLSLFNGSVMCNDGNKLRILAPSLDPTPAEFVLDGPIDALLVSGSLVFAAFHAAVPGHTAAGSPVAQIRAILVRPGAEPVQWSLTAPGQVFAHRDKVNALDVAVISDDQAPVLFSGSEDGFIRMWQLNTATNQWGCTTLEGHARGIASLVWIHPAQRLYSGSTDGTIKVWSPAGSCTGTLLPPAAAAAPAGPRGGGFLAAVAGGPGAAAAPALDGPSHGSAVTCLVEMCLGGQTFLMSGAIDGSIKAWMLTVPDAPQLIPDVKVLPDDKRLISSMICVELESLPGSPLLITGHLNGSVTIRDISSSLLPVATLGAAGHGQPGHSGPVRVLAQGTGDGFYSGAEDGLLSLWQCVVPPPAPGVA